MTFAINRSSSTLKDKAALAFDAAVLRLRRDGCWVNLSVSRKKQKERNCSSHFSSFLCFPGWLLTLSFFYLINGTVSLVAAVIKSNEVSNG